MILGLGEHKPLVDESCFVADSATVVGDVRMGRGSSVWFGAVVRGDEGSIRIGEGTNVQDLCVLHVERGRDLEVGNDVTIGHRAVVHGCSVRDRVLVGMGAIVMNGAEIGEDSMIGAGAIVTEGSVIPPRSLVVGVPGKVRRELTSEEMLFLKESAKHYCKMGARYLESGFSKGR